MHGAFTHTKNNNNNNNMTCRLFTGVTHSRLHTSYPFQEEQTFLQQSCLGSIQTNTAASVQH